MDIAIKLQAFEGPLDLLLHLIDKNKVSIYDIPIAQIADQYMEYLDEMRKADLDIMSEFLVMAATLLDIKSRMLLPAEKNEEGEEIDPREELVQKLLEYKMYKYMAGELRDREDDAAMVAYHKEDIPAKVRSYREPVDVEKLLGGVTLAQLHAVFADVMKRQDDRIDPQRSTFGKIEKQEVDTGAVMKNVEKSIMKKRRCTFRSLLEAKKGKIYVVVTFLTLLELMKMGKVGVEQDDTFGEITITAKDESEWNKEAILESEDDNDWAEE